MPRNSIILLAVLVNIYLVYWPSQFCSEVLIWVWLARSCLSWQINAQREATKERQEWRLEIFTCRHATMRFCSQSHLPVTEIPFAGKKQKGGSSGSGSGLLMPLQLSDDLVKFIGTGESMLSRSDVVKRMWDYIKENNLQVDFFPWIQRCCFYHHYGIAWSFRYWLIYRLVVLWALALVLCLNTHIIRAVAFKLYSCVMHLYLGFYFKF